MSDQAQKPQPPAYVPPHDLLRGKTWKKLIDKSELAEHEERHDLIMSRLYAGRLQIHVKADARPDASFEPATPTLEDVYFSTLGDGPKPAAQAA